MISGVIVLNSHFLTWLSCLCGLMFTLVDAPVLEGTSCFKTPRILEHHAPKFQADVLTEKVIFFVNITVK